MKNGIFGKGDGKMKGYFTETGYMGLINGEYRLFADETDYYEMLGY